LAPKLLREKRHLLKEMSKELDVFFDEKTSTTSRRRLSLDSGRGGSVVAEEEDLVDEASKLEDATTTAFITTTTTTSAVSSTTSLPSRSSSMSSGIGSMHSSYSTLQPQQQSWSKDATTKKDNNEKEFFSSSKNDELSLSSSLTFISSKTFRPTYDDETSKTDEEKSISKQVPFTSEKEAKKDSSSSCDDGVRKLPPQPKRDLDEFCAATSTVRENESSSTFSPPPPPLPPRNAPSKKVGSSTSVRTNSIVGKPQHEFSRLPSKRLPIGQRTASREVAQSVEALQQISQDLLSLMNGQRATSPTAFNTLPLYTPRPRLPSPPPLSNETIVSGFRTNGSTTTRVSAEASYEPFVRSATLPCRRTLNFLDSSLMSEQQKGKVETENNNNIASLETPTLLLVEEEDEVISSTVRRSTTRGRRSSLFRNPLQPRRKSVENSSRRKNVELSPIQPSKAVKRRRTIFSIQSPFLSKNKSSNHNKVRRTSESKPAHAEDWVEPEEERLPIVLDEIDKQDIEEAIRDGLPVIPFFGTPKTGPRSRLNPGQSGQTVQTRRSDFQNKVTVDSMTVRALATPLASRRFPTSRLEDHLVFLPPRSKDLLLDGGYFNMTSSVCSARHCQSCTCQKLSPKLLFSSDQDNNDYVKMDARTPTTH